MDIRRKKNWKINIIDNKKTYFYKNEPWFYIKKSNIKDAGNGLFSARKFKKNELIGYYEGKMIIKGSDFSRWNIMEKPILDKLPLLPYPYNNNFTNWLLSDEGKYVLQYKDVFVDGRFDNFNGTAKMNDPYKTNKKANVILNINGSFKTNKKINIDDELLFQYSKGNTYWKERKKFQQKIQQYLNDHT